jgi:hypothetical protein
MASQLYPTTQDLFRQVSVALVVWLSVLNIIGSPTQFTLVDRPVSVPGRCHDALNRPLRVVPWQPEP